MTKLVAVLAFAKANRAIIVPALIAVLLTILAILAIHLPQPQLRVYAVAGLATLSFFSGILAPHPPAPPL